MAVSGLSQYAISGLATGMDWESIIDKYMTAYKKTGEQLYTKQDGVKRQKVVLQEFNLALTRLQNTAFDLRRDTIYKNKSVTSSDQTIVGAEAGTGAKNGTHTVKVSQLARSARVTSNVLSPRVSNNPSNTMGITGIAGAHIPTPAAQVGISAEGTPDGTIGTSIGSGNNSLTVTYCDTTVTVSLNSATANSTTMATVAADIQNKINDALNISRGTTGVSYLTVASNSTSGAFSFITNFDGSAQSVSVSSSSSAAAAIGFGTANSITTIPGADAVGGKHYVSVTDATANVLSGGALSGSVTLAGADTMNITANGSTFNVSIATAAGTYDTTVASQMTDLAAKLTADITSSNGGTAVATVTWNDASKKLVITDAKKGSSNSVVVNSGTPGTDLKLTSAAGATSTAGTNASATDIFIPASGAQSTSTLTDTTSAGTASDLANLLIRINGVSTTNPLGSNHTTTGGEGPLIPGVALTASSGLTAGAAVIDTTRGNELNTTLATAATWTGGSDVGTTTLTATAALSAAGFTTAASSATNGTFTINGKTITISDYTTTTVNGVLAMINSSGAGVTARYDSTNDRFLLTSNTKGASSTITVGSGTDTSNFLLISKLDSAKGGTLTAGQSDGAIDTSAATVNASGISKTVSAGIFTINGVSLYINPSSESFDDVIEKINNSAAGVTASYNAANDTFNLVSNSDDTGKDVITLGGPNDTSNFLWATNLVYPYMAEYGQTGADSDDVLEFATATGTPGIGSKLEVDGVSYLRRSNAVSDIIDGVTLNLKSTSTSVVNIDITSNTDAVMDKMVSFVSQYNSVMEMSNMKGLTETQRDKQIAALTDAEKTAMSDDDEATYNANREALLRQDILHKDTTVRSVHSMLRRMASEAISGLEVGYRSLADIGIDTGDVGSEYDANLDGMLVTTSTDEDTIRAALEDNTVFMKALKEAPDKVYSIISQLNPSTATTTGTKSIASVTVTNGFSFSVSDGSKSATISLTAKTYTSSNIVSAINDALSDADIDTVWATLNSANQLVISSSTVDGATSGRAYMSISDMSNGSLNSVLGLSPGSWTGKSVESQTGILRRIETQIKTYTTTSGMLNFRIREGGALDTQLSSIEDDIDSFEDRMDMVEKRLWKQFSAMETYVNSKNTVSNWLSNQTGSGSSQG